MNEEKNTPETDSTQQTNDASAATGSAAGFQSATGSNSDETRDDYYAVDHAKKDVISTIGDGEMHDEGLVGAGEISTDLQSSMERLTDEQDEAESHDSEQ